MLNSLSLYPAPIQFGTDGWRGVLGVDVTIERLLNVAIAAAQELVYSAPKHIENREIIIGFDRRFLAPELAEAIAAAIKGCGLEPLLTETAVPTPACSWAVVQRSAIGALVITASHNPPEWIGLKIKGPSGASVDGCFTKAVEKRLQVCGVNKPVKKPIKRFDCRKEHLNALKMKFDLPYLLKRIREMGLKVVVDPMHGSAAGCMQELFGENCKECIQEIRGNRDAFFGGNPPEPLACYLKEVIASVKTSSLEGKPAIGIVFDGDGDRLAAIDEKGRHCSTQLLMPLLIDHLARVRKLPGCIVKTVSGSDLMHLMADSLGREIVELPVGFKYIAAEMASRKVLIGGEESGGIGFGMHLPERDALFTALLVLEALVERNQLLGERLDEIKKSFADIKYDRIDIRLPDMSLRQHLESLLIKTPPSLVAGIKVKEVTLIDGVKLRLGKNHWLMMRFSGTEPLLRIYCEAPDKETLNITLQWAKTFAEQK